MHELTYRKATFVDLPAIVRLLADDELGKTREDASEPLNALYTAAFQAIEQDGNQLLAVVERGGVVLGCLQITFIPGLSHRGMWRGQIEGVRVGSGERGARVGRAMLEWAIEECRRRGCGAVQLTTDKSRTDAHRFYESLGFKATHEGMKLSLRS
jgi:ribosomal protein S18 acetylase RimI-like enzyme